jgi:ribose transport system ATP-binding protein
MVTHRVSEVPAVADRVTVLADGRVVHSGTAAVLTEDQLVSYMLASASEDGVDAVSVAAPQADSAVQTPSGSPSAGGARGSLAALLPGRDQPRPVLGTPVLVVEHLLADRLTDVSFTVGAGEIVGVSGLADSGISELPAVLAGAAPRQRGEIRVSGRALRLGAEPGDCIEAGIALVPGDRLRQGGIQTLTLHENMILPQVGRFWRRGRDERRMIQGAVRALDIHPSDPDAVLAGFSGGNQQRAIIGKWLLMGPHVLVLDDPTSGVDPRARQAIFALLREAAASGLGILFFSTEPEQLVLMCSRILVLRRGSIVQTLSGDELSRDNVARWSAM